MSGLLSVWWEFVFIFVNADVYYGISSLFLGLFFFLVLMSRLFWMRKVLFFVALYRFCTNLLYISSGFRDSINLYWFSSTLWIKYSKKAIVSASAALAYFFHNQSHQPAPTSDNSPNNTVFDRDIYKSANIAVVLQSKMNDVD